MVNSDLILSPYQLNDKITLKNRVIMAPMTRNMANDDFSPTRQMADYYARRADAGLIITEGTIISLMVRVIAMLQEYLRKPILTVGKW